METVNSCRQLSDTSFPVKIKITHIHLYPMLSSTANIHFITCSRHHLTRIFTDFYVVPRAYFSPNRIWQLLHFGVFTEDSCFFFWCSSLFIATYSDIHSSDHFPMLTQEKIFRKFFPIKESKLIRIKNWKPEERLDALVTVELFLLL